MNVDVRTVRGTHGQLVIVGAFCSYCKREALPSDAGLCMWCDRRIVDEDYLRVGVGGLVGAEEQVAAKEWTRERVIAFFRGHVAEHGAPPTVKSLTGASTELRPNRGVVDRVFGSLGRATEAAGFPARRRAESDDSWRVRAGFRLEGASTSTGRASAREDGKGRGGEGDVSFGARRVEPDSSAEAA